MKQTKQILFSTLAIILLLLSLMRGLSTDRDLSLDSHSSLENSYQVENKELVKGEAYYDLEDVAAYIHQYQSLPANYITKKQAQSMGWEPDDPYYVVGGDSFGNREGQLPKKSGRRYYEADLKAGYADHRGPLRLVYSNDGLIFYTQNHYDSFEQLY